MEGELEAALAAAEAAARVCQRVQETLVTREVVVKDDHSPVTVADFAAQAVMNHLLAARLPKLPVVAEEHAEALRQDGALRGEVLAAVRGVLPGVTEEEVLAAIDRGNFPGGPHGRFWAIDPIDGTKGFLRGEQYAVALALLDEGQVILGVLACPALPWSLRPGEPRGCLLAATRGGGSWMAPLGGGPRVPVSVAEEKDPARAVVCESVEAEHSSHSISARIAGQLGITTPPVRMDSQCKYALLARGEASVYLRLPTRPDYRASIWDHAAGTILVEEAGGRVTDLAGQPLDFRCGRTLARNRGIVATNGHLHGAVLAAAHSVLGQS